MVVCPRALLVGDEISLLQTREMVLGTRFDVQISPRLSEAFSLVLKEPFDLVVVFPDTDSWREFGVFIARRAPKPTVVVVSPARGEVPAIFPASASLVEAHEKQHKARAGFDGTNRGRIVAAIDAFGTTMGCIGLAGFAFVFWIWLPRAGLFEVFALAAVVWLMLSVGFWLLRKKHILHR